MSKNSVLITGSSKGLGKSLALAFAKNNYDIVLHGRNEKDLKFAKKEIVSYNAKCEIIRGDITLDSTIDNLFNIAQKKDISVLINNVGIDCQKLFEDFNVNEFEKLIYTNLIAPIKLTKKIYSLFLKRKSGTIININSMDGLKVSNEKRTAYASSKFGLKGFTDALRYESKKHNIRVIGVYPGGMKTKGYKGSNFNNCMEPSEIAEMIYDSCKNYTSSTIDEIIIGRKNY